jgi:NADPH:quinone reductase-like Zn-dependent oxidoreductase
MNALVLPRHGPPDVLRVEHRPDPEPGPGEVRLKVEAAGLNFADLMARIGMYPDAPKVPSVLGYEVAGRIDAVGRGVDTLHAGDRVAAATRFGGFAELAVTKAVDTIPIPDSMPAVDAAAVPVNYATAYAGLVIMGGVRAGDRVLIHGAAGGVGVAATQLARHFDAYVIGSASAAKHDRVRQEGADEVIDHRTRNVGDEVRRLTQGEGVDIILDAIGPKSLRSDWRILRPGGRVIAFGASQLRTGERRDVPAALRMVATFPFATMPWWKAHGMMNENKGVFGLNLLHWWDTEGSMARFIGPLQRLLDAGAIRPVIDSTFPFARAADAHRRLESGASAGKVVLTPA